MGGSPYTSGQDASYGWTCHDWPTCKREIISYLFSVVEQSFGGYSLLVAQTEAPFSEASCGCQPERYQVAWKLQAQLTRTSCLQSTLPANAG